MANEKRYVREGMFWKVKNFWGDPFSVWTMTKAVNAIGPDVRTFGVVAINSTETKFFSKPSMVTVGEMANHIKWNSGSLSAMLFVTETAAERFLSNLEGDLLLDKMKVA